MSTTPICHGGYSSLKTVHTKSIQSAEGLSPLGELWRILANIGENCAVGMGRILANFGELWRILAKSFLASQKIIRQNSPSLGEQEISFTKRAAKTGENTSLLKLSPKFAQWG